MANPTRIDLEMPSGSNATFEFALTTKGGVPVPLPNSTVEMHLSKGVGRIAHAKKSSAPDNHYNSDGGIVRFTVTSSDVPARTIMQTWWYEIWRIESTGSKLHIVGELKLLPTVRMG